MTALLFVRSLSLLTVVGMTGASTLAWAGPNMGYESHNVLRSASARWQLSEGLHSGGIGIRTHHALVAFGRPGPDFLEEGLPTPIAQAVYRWTPHTGLFVTYDNRVGALRSERVSINPSRYRIAAGLSLLPSSSDYVRVGISTGINRHLNATVALFQSDMAWAADIAGPGGESYGVADFARHTGLSFGINGQWSNGIGMRFNYSIANASYVSASCGVICAPVKGMPYIRSPDVPEQAMYGELSWQHPKFGISAAIGARYIGNANAEDSEPIHDGTARYVAANAKLGVEQRFGRWRIQEFARFDNVAFREFKGASYDVNITHRYPEPVPERSYSVGVTAGYSW